MMIAQKISAPGGPRQSEVSAPHGVDAFFSFWSVSEMTMMSYFVLGVAREQ